MVDFAAWVLACIKASASLAAAAGICLVVCGIYQACARLVKIGKKTNENYMD